MATTNIGPRIGIEGEDQYRKQIMNLIQATKTLDAEMKALATTMDKDASAQERAAKQVENLTKKQEAQKQRVETLKKMVAESAKANGENATATLKWREALANAEGELGKTNNQLEEAKKAADGFGEEIEESGNQLAVFNEAAVMMARQNIADTLNQFAQAAGNFGKKVLGGVVETTKDFDAAMSNVKALSGATGSEFDALRKKARDMGATTKYTAGEAADALGYMALAGWKSTEMIDGLDGVLNLAAASGMELAEASDIVTDFLSAFGKSAKDAGKMADMMAYAQANSNTTTIQLGEAFRNSAANMNTAGQTMETTTALLSAMANQGNKGSEAGTALAAMMRDLTQKMKDGKIMIGQTAVQVTDANGNFRNMIDILADVDAATKGMGTAQKSAALMSTFTARSIKGVNQVLNEGVGSLYQYEQELMNASGAAGDMAQTMQDNLEGQLTILKSGLQELSISVGDQLTPYIRKAVDSVQGIIDRFNALPDGVKKAVAVFLTVGTATAIVLPKLIALIQTVKSLQASMEILKAAKAAKEIGQVGDAAQKSSGGVAGLGKAMGTIAGVTAAAVTAVLAINSAIKEYRKKNDEAYAATLKLADAMGEMSDDADNYANDIAEIRKELEAESEMEMTAAERARSAASKYTDAVAKKQDAEKKLIIARKELVKMLGSEEAAERALAAGRVTSNNAAVGLMKSLDGIFGGVTGNVDAYNSLISTIQTYEGETQNADALISDLTKTLEENGYTAEEAAEIAGGFAGAVGDMAEDVGEAFEEIEESFADIYNAAKEDLMASTSLIDQWADESGTSIEDVIKVLEKNAKDWANWSNNVQKVTQSTAYKTDPNFRAIADQIIAMEGKGSPALAQLATEVDKDGSKIVASLKAAAAGAQAEKTRYVNTMSQFQAEGTYKMKQAASGVQQGVNEMVSALNNGSQRVRDRAKAVQDAVAAANPNTAAMKSAMDVYMATYEAAIRQGVPKVQAQAMAAKAAAEQMKVSTNNAYTWGADAVAALAKGMSDSNWKVRKQANILAQDVRDRLGHSTPKLGPLHGDDQWGYHMVDNIIKGMVGSEKALKTAALDVATIMATPSVSVPGSLQVSNSLTYGDIVVNVSGANVQNEDLLARKISDQIFRQVKAQRGAFA